MRARPRSGSSRTETGTFAVSTLRYGCCCARVRLGELSRAHRSAHLMVQLGMACQVLEIDRQSIYAYWETSAYLVQVGEDLLVVVRVHEASMSACCASSALPRRSQLLPMRSFSRAITPGSASWLRATLIANIGRLDCARVLATLIVDRRHGRQWRMLAMVLERQSYSLSASSDRLLWKALCPRRMWKLNFSAVSLRRFSFSLEYS